VGEGKEEWAKKQNEFLRRRYASVRGVITIANAGERGCGRKVSIVFNAKARRREGAEVAEKASVNHKERAAQKRTFKPVAAKFALKPNRSPGGSPDER
jgi:hypothetical protein